MGYREKKTLPVQDGVWGVGTGSGVGVVSSNGFGTVIHNLAAHWLPWGHSHIPDTPATPQTSYSRPRVFVAPPVIPVCNRG